LCDLTAIPSVKHVEWCGGDGGIHAQIGRVAVRAQRRRGRRRVNRSVDDLVAVGVESGVSKSEVSRICAGLDEIVGAFRTRPLDHVEFPYVYLDATYLHVRNATSQVTSMAVVVATSITADGSREILGCDIGDSEEGVFWRQFLRSTVS
jgi:transposase-like protein